MRDFIKELGEIKTAFRGYDREEMMIYIRELLKFCEEEKKKDMEKLIAQTGELRTELDGAKEREASVKAQYDALLGKFEKLSEAMSENARHSEERDAKLDEFNRKKEELDRLLAQTKEKAEAEKEALLKETEKACSDRLEKAGSEADRILSEAGAERQRILAETEAEKNRIMDEARSFQLEMAEKADRYVEEAAKKAVRENRRLEERTRELREVLDSMAFTLAPVLFPDGKLPEKKKGETPQPGTEPRTVAGSGTQTASGVQAAPGSGTQPEAGTKTTSGTQTPAGTQIASGIQTPAGTQTETGTKTVPGTQTPAGTQPGTGRARMSVRSCAENWASREGRTAAGGKDPA